MQYDLQKKLIKHHPKKRQAGHHNTQDDQMKLCLLFERHGNKDLLIERMAYH